MNQHYQITKFVMDRIPDVFIDGSPIKDSFKGLTLEQGCKLIYANLRRNGSEFKGMKLTEVGAEAMQACFKGHKINLSTSGDKKLPVAFIIYLDHVSTFPYWIGEKEPTTLLTFDSELAMMLKLSDNRIDILIENRFRLTPTGQGLSKDI